MQARQNRMKKDGSNTHTDPDITMPSRLAGSRTLQQNHNAFPTGKDSSFPRKQTQYMSESKKKKARAQMPSSGDDEISSDDPINSLSEASPAKASQGGYHDSSGNYHKYLLKHTPSKSQTLKGLKFKKNSRTVAHSVIELDSRTNTPVVDQPEENQTEKNSSAPTWLRKDVPPLPIRSKSLQSSQHRPTPPSNPKPVTAGDIYKSTPNEPPLRPRPRTKFKNAAKADKVDLAKPLLVRPRLGSTSSSSECVDNSPQITAPAPFPMDFTPRPSQATSSKALKSSVPLQFPNLSPPRSSSASPPRASKKTVKLKPFPLSLSKLSGEETGSRNGKGKGKNVRRVVKIDSDSDGSVAPFPLTSQFLSLVGSPTTDACPSATRKKRYSTGFDSDASPRKRSKSDDIFLQDEPFEEESFFISSTTDPKTLCPYCDNPLPSSPSPTLLGLLETMATKSTRDPRPANPLGRKAPFTMFIALCQRHRFESEILPEAERKGWPKAIDWKRLSTRIEDMRPRLELLIDGDADDGPRSQSPFWLDIIEAVKMKGSRAATGVKDQFLNFEKMQPGYYGELGSVIIHQTLYDLFPPVSIDVNATAPLGAEEFLQRILSPEVALRLIMEDKSLRGDLGCKKALQIMRESSAYGVAMFPADSLEYGQKAKMVEGITAGETIVMERARKRRKEIEEEEAREEAEQERKQSERARKPRPKPRPLGKGLSSLMDIAKSDNVRHTLRDDAIVQGDTDPAEDEPQGYRADESSDADSKVAVSSRPLKPNGRRKPERETSASERSADTKTHARRVEPVIEIIDSPMETPRPRRAKSRQVSVAEKATPKPSGSNSTPPLLRAKAMKQQTQRAKIATSSGWIHSMKSDYNEWSDDGWLLDDRPSP